MDESNQPVVEADARRFVDQLDSSIAQGAERPGKIIHEIGDVVESGTPRGEKAADSGIVVDRRKNLNPALASQNRYDVDVLTLNTHNISGPIAKCPVCSDRRIQVIR